MRQSREHQNTISNRLREQVLGALRELLAAFQHADRLRGGALFHDYRDDAARQEIYQGLTTVLMRLVFVLYAEERGLLPMESPLYAEGYSLTLLHAQLAQDRARHGDTIHDRCGAWARVITLFRLLHDGKTAPEADGSRLLVLKSRRGDFFGKDKFPFLEGRPRGSRSQAGELLDVPPVSDGVVYRVLDQLLLLGGERLQYQGLDVEQIGSVYEGLMGFELQWAAGRSMGLLPEHVVVDLTDLLRLPGGERARALKGRANLDVKGKLAAAVKDARSVEELRAALLKRASPHYPDLMEPGTMYLQPGEERRRTGSHYTPRELTAPIVQTALRPVLERLGPQAPPEAVLGLRVCDPAMGSGAFLVEACRQLAEELVVAWRRTGTVPEIPPDEDPVLHARRLVAQQCLYGVDKNPLAVELARLSLWLVTFAREHAFTFVDHALRCGDSLVGVGREQIASFHFDVSKGQQVETVRAVVKEGLARAEGLRRQIQALGDPPDSERQKELWREADEALEQVRMLGDLLVATYFAGKTDKERKRLREEVAARLPAWVLTGAGEAELSRMVGELREAERPVTPFHWEIEFPEVFARENGGFDVMVGNPPFVGGSKISTASGAQYLEWLLQVHPGSHGNGDLVAHFFRSVFELIRTDGTLGLIATNTISQGDTRTTGLRWICLHDGSIYAAQRRLRWPGVAVVVVSVVHAMKGHFQGRRILDGRLVSEINSWLFHAGGNDSPVLLRVNRGIGFAGSKVYGQGFIFDDEDQCAKPISEMNKLIDNNKINAERIFSYIGGFELNTSPTQSHHRFVINFCDMNQDEAERWPDLMKIIVDKVRPERMKLGGNTIAERRKEKWWLWGSYASALHSRMAGMDRVLACSQVSAHFCFAFQATNKIFAHTLNIFASERNAFFAVMQSRIHEVWTRFLASSMKDDLRYTPSDCFETFPFPDNHETDPRLEAIGKDYDEFRADLMIKNNQGLTKTYNRLHDPDESSPGILRLRELHAAMDRAVLEAYGWQDIRPAYDFRPQLDESIRYTWSEDTRDEVLARLLQRNRELADREKQAAAPQEPKKKAPARKKAAAAQPAQTTLGLEDPDRE